MGKETRCIDDELPFDIPDNWTWIKLKDLIDIQTGASFKKDKATTEYKINYVRVLRGGNVSPFRCLLKSDDLYIPKNLVQDHILLNVNDLLTPAVTSLENIGKICKIETPLDSITAGGFVYIFRPYFYSDILSTLIMYFIASPNYQEMLKQITKKSGQAFYNMNKERLKLLYFPLPPINEEKRILERLKVYEPLLSKYELIESKITKIETEFEEKLKASILQYAIEGKLVKQDPKDEPASVLLERIKSEKEKLIKEGKIKRDKNESFIYQSDDKNYYDNQGNLVDVPLEIPSTWLWVKLDDIYQHNTGKALNEKNREGELLEYITTSNLYWNFFVLSDLKKMYFKSSEIEKCTIKEGDLLVCEGGDVGRAAIWNEKYSMRIQNHIHRLRHYYPISNMFYYYVLRLYKYIKYIGGKGIGIQGLSSNALGNILMPLPPLSIQTKITTAVENIYKFIDLNE